MDERECRALWTGAGLSSNEIRVTTDAFRDMALLSKA